MMRFFYFLIFLLLATVGQSQVHLGPKVSGLYYTMDYENRPLLRENDISPEYKWGYNGGIAMLYDIEKRFGLQIEMLYAVKGKKLSGGIAGQFEHEATYKYLEAPIIFKYYLKKHSTYTGFVHFGARFSYWLSGSGEIRSFELDEVGLSAIKYDLEFSGVEDDESANIPIVEPKRVQVGLDIGFGAILNTLHPKNKVIVEAGFQYGQSWLGNDRDILVGLEEYREDFRSSYLTFSLSMGYLFGLDIGQGREGKSTSRVKSKHKRRKR